MVLLTNAAEFSDDDAKNIDCTELERHRRKKNRGGHGAKTFYTTAGDGEL